MSENLKDRLELLKSQAIDRNIEYFFQKLLIYVNKNPENNFPLRLAVNYFLDVAIKSQEIFSDNEWKEEYFNDSEVNFSDSDFWQQNGNHIMKWLLLFWIFVNIEYSEWKKSYATLNITWHDPETYEAVWWPTITDRFTWVNYFIISIIDIVNHSKKSELLLQKDQAYKKQLDSYIDMIDNQIILFSQESSIVNWTFPDQFRMNAKLIFPIKEINTIYNEEYGLELTEEENISVTDKWNWFWQSLIDFYLRNGFKMSLEYLYSWCNIDGMEDDESPRINYLYFQKIK